MRLIRDQRYLDEFIIIVVILCFQYFGIWFQIVTVDIDQFTVDLIFFAAFGVTELSGLEIVFLAARPVRSVRSGADGRLLADTCDQILLCIIADQSLETGIEAGLSIGAVMR